MNESILLLSVTYTALAVLLVGLYIYSSVPVWVKVCTTFLVGGFFFATHNALNGMLGWPTKRELPEEFVMIASRVVEPDKNSKDKGEIFIWAVSINDSYPDKNPRAYRVDYSPELHEELETANWRMRRGITQMGRIEDIDPPNERAKSQYTVQQLQRVVIFDLPDPKLPEK